MELRVLTLNLKGLESGWTEARRDALARQLPGLAPDLIAVQEVAIREQPFYHQALDLAQILGMTAVAYAPYGNPEEVTSPVQGGVALIARWPLQLVENRRLPPGSRHPDNRVALLLSTMHPEGPLNLAVTHLSWPPEDSAPRQSQLATIMARAREYGWLAHASRFLLLGDLNAPPDDPGIHGLSPPLQDAWQVVHPDEPGATWSRANPLAGDYPLPSRRLDYILADPGAEVLDCRVVLDAVPDGVVSDHFGVIATLRWPTG